jgi:endoglucanase
MRHERLDDNLERRKQTRKKSTEAAVGAVVVGMLLSGCVETPRPEPSVSAHTRPSPESDHFFHDVRDPYYKKVAEVLPLANDPIQRQNIERILQTPIAQWLNTPAETTTQIIKENIAFSEQDGGIPAFVAYNIPFRDLGGAAGGGAESAEQYADWIDAISETIADKPAIIILEPDALAGIPGIKDESARRQRIDLLRDALQKFADNNAHTAVYLDAGHSKWQTVDVVVDLIKQVDATGDLVHGLALNVSNQRPEKEIREYAEQIWQKLDYKPYILIDNSMNGAANTAALMDWCNAPGEKIGNLDDVYFDKNEYVEEIYVKGPGESDADCGTSNMRSGAFDNELLLRQVSK